MVPTGNDLFFRNEHKRHLFGEKLYTCSSVLSRQADWLIDFCLTSSEQYFSYIQDENKFHNTNVHKNYIEMREGKGQLSQRLLTATKKSMESWV